MNDVPSCCSRDLLASAQILNIREYWRNNNALIAIQQKWRTWLCYFIYFFLLKQQKKAKPNWGFLSFGSLLFASDQVGLDPR